MIEQEKRQMFQQSRLFIHLSEASVIVLNIFKWQDCKIFTKLVPSQNPSRGSHWRCFIKKVFLKISEISCSFIKKRQQHRSFPVKLRKFLRTPILNNISEGLLLPFLGFTKLNHSIFLWVSRRHPFLYNNIINC